MKAFGGLGARFRAFRKSIIGKITFGYLIIIVIPILAMGLMVYRLTYSSIINEYMISQQARINQSRAGINTTLRKVEGIYQILQTHSQLEDYLSGAYPYDADRIYNYRTYINPVFSYLIASSDVIRKITVYGYNPGVKSVKDVLVPIDRLPNRSGVEDNVKNGKGYWFLDSADPAGTGLKYFKVIFDSHFLRSIGVMELDVDPGFITSQFSPASAKYPAGIYIFSSAGDRLILDSGEAFFDGAYDKNKDLIKASLEARSFFSFKMGNSMIAANKLEIGDLGVNVVVLTLLDDALNSVRITRNYIFAISAVLLILLSMIYYFISYSVSQRITRLAGHMARNRNKSELFHEERAASDEIGTLIEAYNSMIRENVELVDRVYDAQVLRREAEYSALYAQVRPHFICNVLENIRMLAEANNEQEIAGVCFKFSELIRYSINPRREVALEEEIYNIRLYLDIQKTRFGPRLEYEIDTAGNLAGFKCPWFLLQPIVENCVVHGIGKIRGKGMIRVKVTELKDRFVVSIRDNGAGMTRDRLAKIQRALGGDTMRGVHSDAPSKSIGIQNVYGRMKEYYGEKSDLRMESLENEGTLVEMHLGKQGRP